ncbi:MAG: Co2+/Mg2+ efflux protein ApaG [Bdellovibrionales bacterium]|nr:Co2+/Mg2+ efflux protein ApaG [Bdellovibrionales bacterium]
MEHPKAKDTEPYTEVYTETTDGVKVSVAPQFLHDRSELSSGIFAFAYHVTITNSSSEPIKLLNRHWRIFSGGKQISDVKGEGVLGEQPEIMPGSSHSYSSWTVIRDTTGSMDGAYTFVNESGIFFDAAIPEFYLLHLENTQVH